MKRWVKKQAEELDAERRTVKAETEIERSSLRDLIHDVSDVVIALRVATEDLEQALQELSRREGGDDDDPPVGVGG